MATSNNNTYGPLRGRHIEPPQQRRPDTLRGASPASGVQGQRYRGRSSSGPRHPLAAPSERSQSRIVQLREEVETSPGVETRAPAIRWSLRLVLALLGLVALTVGMRAAGGFPPPVDAPLGVEATHAAFARNIAGVDVSGGAGSMPALSAPWQGVAPVDPLAGLPAYSWLVAALSRLSGLEAAGRLVSLLLSTLAGICLFALVHRTAGARAAVYASLLFVVAPLSVIYGRHFSPAALLLFLQAATVLLLVRWRDTATLDTPRGSLFAFALAMVSAFLYGLVDPAALFLAAPALLLLTAPSGKAATGRVAGRRLIDSRSFRNRGPLTANLQKGMFPVYSCALLSGSVAWQLYSAGSDSGISAGGGDTFSVGTAVLSLFSATAYLKVVGGLVGKLTGMLGLLLIGAGLMAGARLHFRYLFHVWLGAAALHILLDAARLPRHEDVLLPLLLPVCAIVGIGAAWTASLPARLWIAVTERRKLADDDYAVSPHTAWLLDLPEERLTDERPSRPQAQLALGKNLAERSRQAGRRARRASLVLGGHVAVTACFAMLLFGNWETVFAADSLTPASASLLAAGREIDAAAAKGAQLVIAGPSAPELFYSSGRAGWAVSGDDFTLSEVQALQRAGASYLVSADQDWLGRQPEYLGLLSNFSVARLSRQYILFDLNTRPSANDRLYFLESGHTLGGEFRRFWESRGGVQKLGYPLSEEYEDVNPLDGQTRTIQYFERAVLELHPGKAGGPGVVMIAAVGRWVTRDRSFPRAMPFKSTQDNAYFAETGHSLKQAFLRFWLREGGLAQFGYPISEELPEISAADGKIYTVQYFERARLEWHPTDAGTPTEVQLGLIGKQALEMRK